jgi:hypothetical protein
MRTLVIALVIAASATARADVGVGLFLGAPTGLDLKIDVGYHSALDIVLGLSTIDTYHDQYAHLTYLATPVVGRGDAVLVPFRIGIGIAFEGESAFSDGFNVAVRAPIELAIRLRRTPLEFYGEIAAELRFIGADNGDFELQGGGGFRIFF